jgi:enoyl-CoA hydratase/carnithine racemase
MRYEHVLISTTAGLTTITMNRPERRNALSEAHMRELLAALGATSADPSTRAVVLAANGSVFSSGHDFADMAERDLDGMRRLLATCTELMLAIQRAPFPVVASVQGLATAAGCQLVATCDLAVAAEHALRAAAASARRPPGSARSTTPSTSTSKRPTRMRATSWRRAR